jgi:heme/copper-type cytochrome/quinol oxidase subunit 3
MTQTGKTQTTMDNKLMIKLIIGTEAMFFLALIMAFVYFSFSADFRSHQLLSLDIKSTGIFSVLLFSSSFTFWRAEICYQKGNIKQLKCWLLLTILLGGIFLFGQGREYLSLLDNHVTISSSIFGTSFFTLTGFHGLHVFAGLIVISIITCLAFLGDYDKPGSSDMVWLFVFIIVYVVPHF